MIRLLTKHTVLTIFLLCVLASVVLSDLIMAGCAYRETFFHGQTKEMWIASSQELDPVGPAVERSIIFVHGFAGSPFDFKPVGEKLSKRGFRVVIPVVPGQTEATLAYRRGDYTPEFYIDWLAKIVEQETKRFDKKPYLVGFSMGGALSTVVASMGTVDRLVLLAPFYSLPYANDLLWTLSRGLMWVMPIVPKLAKGRINDPEGYERYTPGSMIISLRAFDHLEELAVLARHSGPNITIPTLMLFSPNDQVGCFVHAKEVFTSQSNVKVLEYPRSNHVLLYDYDCEAVIEAMIRFLTKA